MGNFLLNFLAAHQQYFIGLAMGVVLSNPITCATILFGLALKIPGFGPWVGRNPDKAKAWFDSFDKGIDAAVDKYAASQADEQPLTPSTGQAAKP